MRANEFIKEDLSLPKNKWEVLISNADKEEVGGQSMRFNKPVAYHKQYNQDHDMYDPDKADL